MKKNIILSALLIIGLTIAAVYGASKIPDLMFVTVKSQHSFEETKKIIKAEVESQGWVNSGENNIADSVQKHTGKGLPPVSVLKVCHADHAYNILSKQEFRYLSALMPCSVSVYEDNHGQVYASHFNTGLMGLIFGEPVRSIMTEDVTSFLNALTSKLN